MLWSQFFCGLRQFLAKNGVFLKNQCYDPSFEKNLPLCILIKKDQFFAKLFGENLLRIITSVPDEQNLKYVIILSPPIYCGCRFSVFSYPVLRSRLRINFWNCWHMYVDVQCITNAFRTYLICDFHLWRINLHQEPILRHRNLQIQRCSRLERFSK
jgi:hypothetical protein